MEPSNVVYDVCRHYVTDFADVLGSEITSTILGHLRSRSISSLTNVSVLFDPVLHGHYVFKILLQVEALFKKCDIFSDEKCSSVAFAAFLESEEICRTTNERLDDFYSPNTDIWIREVIEKMQLIIAFTLGSRKQFTDELPRLVKVTNGATATHPRAKSGGFARLRRTMYATPRSHPYLKALSKFWGYSINFRSIHHNRVELVPKNWKTHRSIACEPEGNSALQLAFDSFCKRQLKIRLNTDLSDQSRNQRKALESSVHGKLCTVDLKAASDRLALNVIHLLFDREWVDFFLATRSPRWKFGDAPSMAYHKLSSMGNGYTFTVETLVFAAACKALGSHEFSVYGDDIIIEVELYERLMALLAYLGFEINREKTHATVPTFLCDGLPSNQSAIRTLGLTQTTNSRVGDNRDDLFAGLDYGARNRFRDEGSLALVNSYISDSSGPGSPANTYGVYRESCGVHAWGGHIITPFYLRSLKSKQDWVLMVNNMASLGTLGGSLWNYLQEIILKVNLPLGPPVLNTAACVFIDVHSCYRLKLIRTLRKKRAWSPYIPVYRSLVNKGREIRCYDSRALFFWFLNRRNRPFESSRYSLGTHKSKSKWVRYSPAMADLVGGSVHLHWWTETLLARKGQ
jgi:hypothetical protein